MLENAAQYGPPGSAIEVAAGVVADALTITVRDHGPGLAAVDAPHVFERFYRGEGARLRSAGTGMGLWIARGFLAAQGGRIFADNAPGGGARFTIVVPVA